MTVRKRQKMLELRLDGCDAQHIIIEGESQKPKIPMHSTLPTCGGLDR